MSKTHEFCIESECPYVQITGLTQIESVPVFGGKKIHIYKAAVSLNCAECRESGTFTNGDEVESHAKKRVIARAEDYLSIHCPLLQP